MSEENKSTIPEAAVEAVALTDDQLGDVAGGFMIGIAGKKPPQKFQNGQVVRLVSGEPFICSGCFKKNRKRRGQVWTNPRLLLCRGQKNNLQR